jgi:hypothetical protein
LTEIRPITSVIDTIMQRIPEDPRMRGVIVGVVFLAAVVGMAAGVGGTWLTLALK